MNRMIVVLQGIVFLLGDGKAFILITFSAIGNRSCQLIRLQTILIHLEIPIVAVGVDYILPLVGSVLIPLLPKPDQIIFFSSLSVQRLIRIIPVCMA